MHSDPYTRRNFLKVSGITITGAGIISYANRFPEIPSDAASLTSKAGNPSNASSPALQELVAGNLRFQRGEAMWPNQTIARRTSLTQKQEPFAIIFSCVDSRVPPELIFDRGLGDIFTIRTAGHVIDQAALGSLEFGVAELHIPLLMVLGHERCGAVAATIQAVDNHEELPGSIKVLVDYIRPAVQIASGIGATRLDNAVRANTKSTVQALRQSSIINDAVTSRKLTLVAARYDLDTGAVSIISVEQ